MAASWPPHLGRDADLGCTHDTDDGERGQGTPQEISADARDDEDEGEHDDAWDRAASHALACA